MTLLQALSFYAANADNEMIALSYRNGMEKFWKAAREFEAKSKLSGISIEQKEFYLKAYRINNAAFVQECVMAQRALVVTPPPELDPVKIIAVSKPVIEQKATVAGGLVFEPTGTDITKTTTIPPSEAGKIAISPEDTLSRTDLTGAPAEAVTYISESRHRGLPPGQAELEAEQAAEAVIANIFPERYRGLPPGQAEWEAEQAVLVLGEPIPAGYNLVGILALLGVAYFLLG